MDSDALPHEHLAAFVVTAQLSLISHVLLASHPPDAPTEVMDEITLEYQGIPNGNCSDTGAAVESEFAEAPVAPITMYSRSPGRTK
jgi:hypothetical protein